MIGKVSAFHLPDTLSHLVTCSFGRTVASACGKNVRHHILSAVNRSERRKFLRFGRHQIIRARTLWRMPTAPLRAIPNPFAFLATDRLGKGREAIRQPHTRRDDHQIEKNKPSQPAHQTRPRPPARGIPPHRSEPIIPDALFLKFRAVMASKTTGPSLLALRATTFSISDRYRTRTKPETQSGYEATENNITPSAAHHKHLALLYSTTHTAASPSFQSPILTLHRTLMKVYVAQDHLP